MPQPEWRARIEQYVEEQARPVEKFGHQPRLYELTVQIGTGLSYDDDVVHAAAWLHDMGVFVGHRPEEPRALEAWDSVAYALDLTPKILTDVAFPPEKIPAVVECIRTHQPQFAPTTLEATILRDADILEQLGAIGILRTVCKVGRDTRFATFTQAAASLQRALDTLPPLLRLPQSALLAEPRIHLHRAFLASTASEAGLLLL
jgi:uncharacterized protein